MNRNMKIVIFVIFVIIFLITAGLGLLLVSTLADADAKLGLVEVEIDGRYANITGELDIEPEIDPEGTDLRLDLGSEKVPVLYNGSHFSSSLTEDQFRKVLSRDELNMTGTVKVPLAGPFEFSTDVREEINISFIHELANSLNVSGVEINFTGFGTGIEVFFLLDADVERDVLLSIEDTPARLTSPAGTFNARVRELHFRTGQGGYARVTMPPITALGLALYHRDVLIESWGITAVVTIPLFSV